MKIKVSKKTAIRSIAVKRTTILAASICGVIGIGMLATHLSSATTRNDSIETLSAEINPQYEEYLRDVQNGNASDWPIVPKKYISRGRIRDGFGDTTTLPASYSLISQGYGTKIKNQGQDGACWAYATTTALESAIKKQGHDIEFSPKQLDYLMEGSTPYGQYYKTINSDVNHQLGDGANMYLVSALFYGSEAPVFEEDFYARMKANDSGLGNYNSFQAYWESRIINPLLNPLSTYTKPMAYNNVIADSNKYYVGEVENYAIEDIGTTNAVNSIKKSVYENGAVYIQTYAPGTEGCWDATTETIVDRGTTCGNKNGHAMTIVGWDDTYQYTDPATSTTKQGAFLVQNSWGESNIFEKTYGSKNQAINSIMGQVDPSHPNYAQIRAAVEDYVNNYDADEFIHLGYNIEENNTASFSYAIFKDIEEISQGVSYVGLTSMTSPTVIGSKNNELVYTYNTNSEKEIKSIAVADLVYPFSEAMKFKVYVENGNGYKEAGQVIYPAAFMGKKQIKLSTPIVVNGTFKVKIALEKNDGTPIGFSSEFIPLFNTVVKLEEKSDVTPDDPTPDDPDDPGDPDDSGQTPTGEVNWIQGKTHTKNSGKNVVLKIDYPLDSFQSITLDGVAVAETNYEVASGSTIIKLHGDFVDSLDEGEHTLIAYFTDNIAVTAKFTVSPESSTPTDDEEDIVVPDTSEGNVKVPNTGSLNDGVDFASFGGVITGATILFLVATTVYLVKNKDVFGKKVGFDKK